MEGQYIKALEVLASALKAPGIDAFENILVGTIESVSKFLEKTLSEHDYDVKCGEKADELLDEVISALVNTEVVDQQVFRYVTKLSCFYGTNVRAFLVLSKYAQLLEKLDDTDVTTLLLNRIMEGDEYSWKMAKLVAILVTKFQSHRNEAAKMILNYKNPKFGEIVTKGTNISLQCYFIEILTVSTPQRKATVGPPFLARFWSQGPDYLWKSIPPPPAASKDYVNYLEQVDILMKNPPRHDFFVVDGVILHFPNSKSQAKGNYGFFHIFDDTLILWRSNDENNTERLEPVELFLHALVRVTKDRHRKQQLSFVAPFNRVAAGDISNEWQSVVVDLEFSSDEAEKNSLTCIMQTMDRLGVPRPETNGVLFTKMSVANTIINASANKLTMSQELDPYNFQMSETSSSEVSVVNSPLENKVSQASFDFSAKSFPPIQYDKPMSKAKVDEKLLKGRKSDEIDTNTLKDSNSINEKLSKAEKFNLIVSDKSKATKATPKPITQLRIPVNGKGLLESARKMPNVKGNNGFDSDDDEFWNPHSQHSFENENESLNQPAKEATKPILKPYAPRGAKSSADAKSKPASKKIPLKETTKKSTAKKTKSKADDTDKSPVKRRTRSSKAKVKQKTKDEDFDAERENISPKESYIGNMSTDTSVGRDTSTDIGVTKGKKRLSIKEMNRRLNKGTKRLADLDDSEEEFITTKRVRIDVTQKLTRSDAATFKKAFVPAVDLDPEGKKLSKLGKDLARGSEDIKHSEGEEGEIAVPESQVGYDSLNSSSMAVVNPLKVKYTDQEKLDKVIITDRIDPKAVESTPGLNSLANKTANTKAKGGSSIVINSVAVKSFKSPYEQDEQIEQDVDLDLMDRNDEIPGTGPEQSIILTQLTQNKRRSLPSKPALSNLPGRISSSTALSDEDSLHVLEEDGLHDVDMNEISEDDILETGLSQSMVLKQGTAVELPAATTAADRKSSETNESIESFMKKTYPDAYSAYLAKKTRLAQELDTSLLGKGKNDSYKASTRYTQIPKILQALATPTKSSQLQSRNQLEYQKKSSTVAPEGLFRLAGKIISENSLTPQVSRNNSDGLFSGSRSGLSLTSNALRSSYPLSSILPTEITSHKSNKNLSVGFHNAVEPKSSKVQGEYKETPSEATSVYGIGDNSFISVDQYSQNDFKSPDIKKEKRSLGIGKYNAMNSDDSSINEGSVTLVKGVDESINSTGNEQADQVLRNMSVNRVDQEIEGMFAQYKFGKLGSVTTSRTSTPWDLTLEDHASKFLETMSSQRDLLNAALELTTRELCKQMDQHVWEIVRDFSRYRESLKKDTDELTDLKRAYIKKRSDIWNASTRGLEPSRQKIREFLSQIN